jgi:two-component system NtrC family sensor kinase
MAQVKKRVLTIEGAFKDNFVEIHIIDTGVGIPEENLSKVFDPFFTTKEKGTGLGLSVTYGIIMNHGGEISIFSKLNEGTRVVLKFPLSFSK